MRNLLAILAAALSVSAAAAVPSLDALSGHHRVLVVLAPEPGSKELAAQDRMLAADPGSLTERDIIVVHVVGAAVSGVSDDAAALRRRLMVLPVAFAVRLIGKDGHVALREVRPIALDRLFATIDAMPMRRAEMRRRGH